MRIKERGSSIIELASILCLLTVVALLCADIGMIALASSLNDQACRDAARAAAQGSNMDEALKMATASVKSHEADGYFITSPTIPEGGLVYEDYGGRPPQDESPYVEVTTTSTVRVPAPIIFFGAKFGDGGTINFSRKYTFPIVRTQLVIN
jgi:Flp pilus assembly protein TadG